MKKYEIEEARKKVLISEKTKGVVITRMANQKDMAKILKITTSAWNLKENYKRALTANELLILSEKAGLEPRQIILTR